MVVVFERVLCYGKKYYEKLNEKLKEEKKKDIKLTQSRISEMICVDIRTFQRYLSGERTMSPEMLPKIANIANTSTDYLLNDYEAKLESVPEEIEFRNSELCSINEKISEYEKEHTKEELECDEKYIEMLVLKEKIKYQILGLSNEQAYFKGQRMI